MQSPPQSAALLQEAKKLQRRLAVLLCLLYVAFAIAHPILSPAIAGIMTPIALLSAAFAALTAIYSTRIPLPASHAVAGCYGLIILVNSVAQLYLTGQIDESTNMILVLLAVGVTFYSWRWFWFVVVVTFASWVWATRSLIGSGPWIHYLFGLVLSATMAALYQRLRISAVWQLAQSRSAEVQRTFELAESNIELQRAARKLKDQAKELEKQNEVLAENVRLKDDVERISRHDLRTPLNSIISLSQIVREDADLPPQHQASLQLIEQAGYRVLNMANLTLDLFKMEQGTYVFTPGSVDIEATAVRALVDLGALMRTREVTCKVECEPTSQRAIVRGDELLAHSMLSNLLKNAIEASSKGDNVGVRIICADPVQLRIHNRGSIPLEIRPRFFEKYATRGKKGGTGLGAYSASLMAKTQGGTLRVESSDEDGTTMIIELPRSQESREPPADASLTTSAVVTAGNLAPRSVLIVDDDPNNRAILRHFLAETNWSVAEAENGPLALLMCKDAAWDFVLLDIEMPVMDGFEVAAQIRAIEKEHGGSRRAAIAALSSHSDDAVRQRALSSGFDRYLTKPVNRRTVIEFVAGSAVVAEIAIDPEVRHLIPSFVENKKREVEHVRAALASGDRELARREFHRLRGSFGMYGFRDVAALCAELENLARSDELAAAEERLPQLAEHLNRIRGWYEETQILLAAKRGIS